MVNLLLYALTVSIWGSTWLVITFQLGTPVATAIGWRFILASLMLLCWCLARRVSLRFDSRQWTLILLQGLMNYCINYWMVYMAEARISSGLVAVLFSLLMVFNMIGGHLFFAQRINAYGATGAAMGIIGVGLVFWPELAGFEGTGERFTGVLLALSASLFSSCGNLLSVQTQKSGVPLIPGMALGMGMAGAIMLAFGGVSGDSLLPPMTTQFLLSLLYLSLLGSVVAFAAYLGLIQRIGAAMASYANVLIPIVALALSSLFEGYQWKVFAVAGLGVSLAGNLLVMRGRMKAVS